METEKSAYQNLKSQKSQFDIFFAIYVICIFKKDTSKQFLETKR